MAGEYGNVELIVSVQIFGKHYLLFQIYENKQIIAKGVVSNVYKVQQDV